MKKFKEQSLGNQESQIWDFVQQPAGHFPPSALPFSTPNILRSFSKGYEVISDEHTSRKNWNPVSHYKREAYIVVSPLQIHLKSDSTLFQNEPWWFEGTVPSLHAWTANELGPPDSPLGGIPEMFEISEDEELVVPPPYDLESLLDDAARHLLPGLKQELSIINSIIELKDFKSLSHTFRDIDGTLSRFGQYVGLLKGKLTAGQFRKMKSTSFAEWARRYSSGYLQYSFNIAPLYSDIQGLMKTLKRYNAQANRLVSQSERCITRHHSVMIHDDYESSNLTRDGGIRSVPLNGTVPYITQSHADTFLDPAKFHVEIQYDYHYTEFQKQHAALLSVLDKIGVSFDPAIIWNAIPYTFVIDWVFGVGRHLNSMKRANMEPVINIRKSLWSIRRVRKHKCFVDAAGQKGLPVSFVQETAYRRQPYQMTAHSIESSGLSLREVSLGAALALSRRRRH